MTIDNSCVVIPGPWDHRYVQANGAQFHVVTSRNFEDDGALSHPLVLLIHGYPQYWYAWRHLLPAIETAGYRVAAMDQRGFGGSDKTPDCHDSLTLTTDILAVARSLGASSVILVGHGRGGSLAWAAAAKEPGFVRGLVTISATHPTALHRLGIHLTAKTWKHVASTFTPRATAKRLQDPVAMHHLLSEWSAPNNEGAAGEARIYSAAMTLPGAADVALDQLRWTWSSRILGRGRNFLHQSNEPVTCPVWTLRGELDPLLPDRAWAREAAFTTGDYRHIVLPHAGHFPAEEQPDDVADLVLEFIRKCG